MSLKKMIAAVRTVGVLLAGVVGGCAGGDLPQSGATTLESINHLNPLVFQGSQSAPPFRVANVDSGVPANMPARNRSLGPSRMDAAACAVGKPVIYTDSVNSNTILIFPQNRKNLGPCGHITSVALYQPQGMAVDAQGNLWVVSSGNKTILEFAPGATKPKLTLRDPNGQPIGVAIDNNSGTVYVADAGSYRNPSGGGTVEVYPAGRKLPTRKLTDPNLLSAFYVAVDNAGNVYADFYEPGVGGQVDEWIGGASGTPLNLGIAPLTGAIGQIQTTQDGSLLICDYGVPACGQFLAGQTTMTNTFATWPGRPVCVALDAAEDTAFVVDAAHSEIDAWKYPGPDSTPLYHLNIGTGGITCGAVSPAAPQGSPY